jgi:uncharacterized DUF497 family protein
MGLERDTGIPYNGSVKISVDPAKDARNRRERGIPLAFGAVVLTNRIGEVEDTRRDYGEMRIKAFGRVDGLMFCCVYTMRGEVTHVITVHRVSEKEAGRWLKTTNPS